MSTTDMFTCVTCNIAFDDPELQRAHYKTDWHRYNLKRKVAEMPAINLQDFLERVQLQKIQVHFIKKNCLKELTLIIINFKTKNRSIMRK